MIESPTLIAIDSRFKVMMSLKLTSGMSNCLALLTLCVGSTSSLVALLQMRCIVSLEISAETLPPHLIMISLIDVFSVIRDVMLENTH
jgi:hypothetical protein